MVIPLGLHFLLSLALLSPQKPPSKARAAKPALLCANTPATTDMKELDLAGDGGVLKKITSDGTGTSPPKGSLVTVHYEGKLQSTGAKFDSSRDRGKPFKFTLGDGKVIGGWEVGISTMTVGEKATLICKPQYAYGSKGIPPLIPPDATLVFEVELLSADLPLGGAGTFAADNPTSPRTPDDIKSAYEKKMAAKEDEKGGIEGLIEWAKGIYIFGFFSGKEERPPWFLNPLITFPAIFVIVGLGFTLTVGLGGVHRGEVPAVGDDLEAFIGKIE